MFCHPGNMIHRREIITLTPIIVIYRTRLVDFSMNYMKWIYPRRLRNQMILMAILMVIVPTLTIGYIVETEGRSAVLSEKEKNFLPWSICLIRR